MKFKINISIYGFSVNYQASLIGDSNSSICSETARRQSGQTLVKFGAHGGVLTVFE
jgi:hypothetical protein